MDNILASAAGPTLPPWPDDGLDYAALPASGDDGFPQAFLLQIAGMGVAGGILGSFFGFLLQESFPVLFADLLPFEVETEISPEFFFMGLLLGILMSVLFALIPLLSTWYVSPLRVLRITNEDDQKSKRAISLVASLIFGFVKRNSSSPDASPRGLASAPRN